MSSKRILSESCRVALLAHLDFKTRYRNAVEAHKKREALRKAGTPASKCKAYHYVIRISDGAWLDPETGIEIDTKAAP